MEFEPIVKSLLDTDLYKFNMNQVMFHKHTNLNGTYLFKCRNADVIFTNEMVDEINKQIDYLCTLHFKDDELNYLASLRFIKSDYIEFLRIWHPLRRYVTCHLNPDNSLYLEVSGPLFTVMQFEIYLLEIVNEVYFRFTYAGSYLELLEEAMDRIMKKRDAFRSGKYTFNFAEFGCRRRFNKNIEEIALTQLLKTGHCVGTSNVYLAMKYGCTPIGTYAHELVQMYQGIPTIPAAYTNKIAMQEWFEEYNGDNGTALTDTLSTDVFLLDFDKIQANMYTGVRHDSGDPYTWGEKIIQHYIDLGIDPKTKTLLFSDSLDFDKAQAIYDYFKDRIKVSFGIGTFISNDVGVPALNIVIKLQYVNGQPVAKISDNIEKAMCRDAQYLAYLNRCINWRLLNNNT